MSAIETDNRNPEFAPLYTAIDIRAEIARLQGGYRVNLWRCIADAYGVAMDMSSNLEAYKAFLDEDFWQSRKKRPNADSTKNILLNVMLFVFNATNENAYSRAWKYAKALEAYFNDKVPPGQIRDLIEEEGGIEAMLKKAAKRGLANDAEPSGALNPDADDVDMGVPEQVKEEDEDQKVDEDRLPSAKKAGARDKKTKQLKARVSDSEKTVVKRGSSGRTAEQSEYAKRAKADRFRLLVEYKFSRKFGLLKIGQTADIQIKMVQFKDTVRPEMTSFKRTHR